MPQKHESSARWKNMIDEFYEGYDNPRLEPDDTMEHDTAADADRARRRTANRQLTVRRDVPKTAKPRA
jgi:hypothetical protein